MRDPIASSAASVRPIDPAAPAGVSRRVLGRGRSGLVYAEILPGEAPAAVKVFLGDPAGDLVNTLLTGAPAPYAWCEAAVRCAMHRRNVLADLVDFWFGDHLRVARARGVRWSSDERAWELRCDLVQGRPAALHHPFSAATDDEQRELVDEVMRPLQARLRAAGFVGMLWQAGLGNPVAADNFLRDLSGDGRWVWIDLESGVPALFPLDPRPLVSTYLPWTLTNRRALFDDTDLPALRAYLRRETSALREHLGAGGLERLAEEVDGLEESQRQWRRLHRVESSIIAALVKGRITEDEAAHYFARPTTWLAAEARRHAAAALNGLRGLGARLVAAVRRWKPVRNLRAAGRFMVSQAFRERVARLLLRRRIRHWRRRGHLGQREGAFLRRESGRLDQAAYLTDFVVHLALKPVYKVVVWLVLPALAQLGLVAAWVVPVGLVAGGSVTRTLYTIARGVRARLRGDRFPWVALAVGTLPVVGSAAYPAQVVQTSRTRGGKLAALLLYDTLTGVGRSVPIWGGPDSLTEHGFNRLADRIVESRDPLLAPASSDGS